MLLQRTLFTGQRAWVNDDLYACNTRGSAVKSRHSVTLEAGGCVTANTYFGRFAASYWQRWTRVNTVELRATVTADPGVHTTVLLRASDIGGHQRTVGEVVVEGSQRIALQAPLASFFDGGALWVEVCAREGTSTVAEVSWHSVALASARDHSHVGRRFAIAVCTFNRPLDCAATVSALADDELVRATVDQIYVTDQGDQLVEEQPGFQHAADLFGNKLQYVRQPNLGGSGGFTRGIFEATNLDGPVDVLLMDDDVRVEPETVIRMRAFAALTRQPTIVGAQMMFLFNPDCLLASAEGVDLTSLRRGTQTDPFGLTDANMVEGELPERRVDAEYNGWWSCLIPSEVVERIGLPMPFFFQWDDVEYSLRGRRNGIATVTLPGAAVWHADFYWKDIDGFGHFFSTRNGLITAALDPNFDVDALAKNTLRDIRHAILGMQYGLAHVHMDAVRAFLLGPVELHDGGQADVRRVSSERSQFREARPISPDDIPSVARVARSAPPPDPNRELLVMVKRLVMSRFGRRIPGPTMVAFEDSHWYNTSLYEDVYVTDASQESVRHRRFDKAQSLAQVKELHDLMKRFRKEAPQVALEYRESFEDLISRRNWQRLYGMISS